MTPTLSDLKALSDDQLVEKLAFKVKGWRLLRDETYKIKFYLAWYDGGGKRICKQKEPLPWKPITDWNHMREVEERIMQDERLIHRYWDAVMVFSRDTCPIPRLVFIFADQRTRCLAALLALSSPQA